jgi:hypothetical protein
MLLSFAGVGIKQEEVAGAAGVEHRLAVHGMSVPEMGLAVTRLSPDTEFWFKHHSSVGEVNKIVHEFGFPVGVEWQGEFGSFTDDDNGHYSIVVDVNKPHGTITIADPYEGHDRIFGIHVFENRWWDVNEVFDPHTGHTNHVADDRTMFVIVPPGTLFPHLLGMHKVE